MSSPPDLPSQNSPAPPTPHQDRLNQAAGAPAGARGEVVDRNQPTPQDLTDPYLRGRRLIAFTEAQHLAQSELEEWDRGLHWGGLYLPSSVATTHFCAVGAPGSGKTMLLRLLMQSILPLVGSSEKTKDISRWIEVPQPIPPAPAPQPPVPSRKIELFLNPSDNRNIGCFFFFLSPLTKLMSWLDMKDDESFVSFSESDIVDAGGFYNKILESRDPLTQYIQSQCRFPDRKYSVLGQSGGMVQELTEAQMRNLLCSGLNKLIGSNFLIYSTQLFPDIYVSNATGQLAVGYFRTWKKTDLNRILLEKAFPSEIRKKVVAMSKVQIHVLVSPPQPAPPPPPAPAPTPIPPREEITKGPQWEGHRAIIYDAKQDILSLLHGMKGVHAPIYTLNPFDERCAAWDMGKDITAPATAQQVATLLIPENKNASQPFFTDAARHLLTGVMIALMKKAKKDWDFRDVVLAMKSRKNLVALLQSIPETEDLVEQYLPADESGRNVTAQNIMSSIATKMAPFEFVAAAWSQAKHKISLKDWLASEYILVLGNDEAHRSSLDAINRVLFKRMTELILAQNETTTGRTWIFLDEAREAGDLDGLGRLMTKGRSKGACVVLGFQDIDGMREAYGEKLAHEIVGMCASKAILRLESPETAKWASEVFGEFEAYEDKQGWSKGGGTSTGEATTTGTATTTGSSTTQGSSNSKTKGSSSGTTYSSSNSSTWGENDSKSENHSESRNSSESKNTSKSDNWNESLNRERVQRAALIPSQFQSLPATNPKNGLTGYFVSPYIGAYKSWVPGYELEKLLHDAHPSMANIEHRDEDHQYLAPWSNADYTRLGIPKPVTTPASNTASSSGQAVTNNQSATSTSATSTQGASPPGASSPVTPAPATAAPAISASTNSAPANPPPTSPPPTSPPASTLQPANLPNDVPQGRKRPKKKIDSTEFRNEFGID